MKTAKLHELIQLAKTGKKFKASYDQAIYNEKYFQSVINWHWNAVLADWEYEEIEEPEVLEFDINANNLFWSFPNEMAQKLDGKKWKVVCTEVIE